MSEQQKGKYIEISKKHSELGEQVSWHAEKGIGIQSGKSIKMHGAENGIVFGTNIPMPDKIKPDAKCMVLFRPAEVFLGEYGFDWIRTGDTYERGDFAFEKIMGCYYEADNVTIYQGDEPWTATFRASEEMYKKKLKSYNSLPIPWKNEPGKSPYLYRIPRLTLLKGKKAMLSLILEIEEKPRKLTFEFKDKNAEKYLQLNKKQIEDIKTGEDRKMNYLVICCAEEFDTEQTLYVKSDGVICGALSILPNAKQFRKNIDVVFIQVKTDVNGDEKTGTPAASGVEYLTQILGQALVIPNFRETVYLNCSSSAKGLGNSFRDQCCIIAQTGPLKGKYVISNFDQLKTYLETALNDQFGDSYTGCYTIFFLDEDHVKLTGISAHDTTFAACFKSHNKEVIPHEVCHAMGLWHTFDGFSHGIDYNYEMAKTDNVMDYGQFAERPAERKTLYHWQWKLLNPNIGARQSP